MSSENVLLCMKGLAFASMQICRFQESYIANVIFLEFSPDGCYRVKEESKFFFLKNIWTISWALNTYLRRNVPFFMRLRENMFFPLMHTNYMFRSKSSKKPISYLV